MGTGDCTKFKTQERTRIGLPGQPVAELIELGWIVISPGQETTVTNLMPYLKPTAKITEISVVWMSLALRKITRKRAVWYMMNFKST